MAKQILQEAGLSGAEINVYRCLLQNGPLKVSEISKRVGMYRPYVYDNLYKLIGKGLCSNIIIDGKKVFKAASPETLHDYMEEKMRAIDEIIPELEKEMLKGHDETQVWVYRGKNAIRKALMDILKELKAHPGLNHLGIGIDELVFMKSEPLFSRWFIRQLEKNKIKERLISYETEKIFIGGTNADYRLIPDEYFNPAQTLIDGNLV
ncbi:MAG: helix-turn-helix domain-containing protein, partial [Candidatus Micrarchaeota archaeon]